MANLAFFASARSSGSFMDASKARRRIIIRSLGVPGGNEYGRLREPPMSWITVFITCRPSSRLHDVIW